MARLIPAKRASSKNVWLPKEGRLSTSCEFTSLLLLLRDRRRQPSTLGRLSKETAAIRRYRLTGDRRNRCSGLRSVRRHIQQAVLK